MCCVSQILTFDAQGVSGHPNHIALPTGALELAVRRPAGLNVSIFALATSPVVPKYLGILAPAYHQVLAKALGQRYLAQTGIRFVSNFWGYVTAFHAMQAHWSQLVWFRWLYIMSSQYMWMNEWTLITSQGN